jgi:hypothetical protein
VVVHTSEVGANGNSFERKQKWGWERTGMRGCSGANHVQCMNKLKCRRGQEGADKVQAQMLNGCTNRRGRMGRS